MLTKTTAIKKLSALSIEQLQTVMAFVDLAMPNALEDDKKNKVKLGVLSNSYVDDDLFDKLDSDVLTLCSDCI